MKICLIRPSIIVPASNQTTMMTPPLGLAYVAGSLRAAGHEVQFIDAVGEDIECKHPYGDNCYIFGLTPSQTVNKIFEDIDVIGIAFGFSFEWPYCRDLTKLIRKRFPKIFMMRAKYRKVIGGFKSHSWV